MSSEEENPRMGKGRPRGKGVKNRGSNRGGHRGSGGQRGKYNNRYEKGNKGGGRGGKNYKNKNEQKEKKYNYNFNRSNFDNKDNEYEEDEKEDNNNSNNSGKRDNNKSKMPYNNKKIKSSLSFKKIKELSQKDINDIIIQFTKNDMLSEEINNTKFQQESCYIMMNIIWKISEINSEPALLIINFLKILFLKLKYYYVLCCNILFLIIKI